MRVAKYVVTSAFQVEMNTPGRLNAKKQVMKDETSPLHDKKQMAIDAEEKRREWVPRTFSLNIFRYSKFSNAYIYECIHPLVEEVYFKRKKDSIAKENIDPEKYQMVSVASRLLKYIFKEPGLEAMLRKNMSVNTAVEEQYITLYGSLDQALENASDLQGRPVTLPLGQGIPTRYFSAYVSKNLVSVASFFAAAMYDEESFNLAQVLLLPKEMEEGEAFPQGSRFLGAGFNETIHRLGKDYKKQKSLFSRNMEEGGVFVENVVKPLNEFTERVHSDNSWMQKYKTRITMETRLQSLMFRTHASEMVEIYVSHGLFPRHSPDLATQHPDLMEMFKENKNASLPIPVILDYITLAIETKNILPGASHYYTTNKDKLLPWRSGDVYDGGDMEKLREEIVPDEDDYCNPDIRDIRCKYHLVDAKVKNQKGDKKAIPFQKWLNLTEVVNVILFGMRNPWITAGEKAEFIDWTPEKMDLSWGEKRKKGPMRRRILPRTEMMRQRILPRTATLGRNLRQQQLILLR
jgi:hypothetical protein